MNFNISEEESFICAGEGLVKKLNREGLILHGEGDRVVNFKDLQYTQKIMGKWVRLIMFKEGSNSLISDFPEDVTRFIIEFVVKDDFMKDYIQIL